MCLLLLIPAHTHAQVLQGQWVQECEEQINKHRKTGVTVIVLDRDDKAVEGVTVELTQLRHDFKIGLTLPADRLAPEKLNKLPVYRCFNAIALDRLTDWSLPTKPSEFTPDQIVASWRDAIKPIEVAYGRVISADTARNTDKLLLLTAEQLRDALFGRIDLAIGHKPTADRFDVYADLLYQDLVERKLGQGMLHRMFERAHAKRPEAKLSLRVRNAISLQRGRDLALTLQRLEARQVRFDSLTIEQRFTGQVQPRPLERMLNQHVASLNVPVTLAGIEVGGTSDVAAGLNMETLLRLTFAQPAIQGLYFSSVHHEQMVEDNAALIGKDGQPTTAGVTLDNLFQKVWRSDVKDQTDEVGNVHARVFTGWYRAQVTLPNGKTIWTDAYVPKSDRSKLIVLQQTAAEVALNHKQQARP